MLGHINEVNVNSKKNFFPSTFRYLEPVLHVCWGPCKKKRHCKVAETTSPVPNPLKVEMRRNQSETKKNDNDNNKKEN